MTYQEVLAGIKKFNIQEERSFSEELVEVVLSADAVPRVQAFLELFFGPPLKPAGDSPSPEANLLAKPYGGIRDNQIMYLKREAGITRLAFFWPWGNGALVTLKIFTETSSKEIQGGKGPFGFFKKIFN